MVLPRYPKPKERCRGRKLIYIDEKHVKQVIRLLQAKARNKDLALRHYKCPYCNRFHITKRGPRTTMLELSFESDDL